MSNAFWTGGRDAHEDAISEQHRQRMEQLQIRLNNCNDDTERSQLENEIQTAEQAFQTELKNVKWKLF